MNKQRFYFPDILKAFLIYFVVLGHTISLYYKGMMDLYWNNPIITFIYSFHMPLFIAISGYFIGHGNSLISMSYFVRKISRLLYPIITCFFVSLLLDYLFHIYTQEEIHIFRKYYAYITKYWYLDYLLILSVGYYICRYVHNYIIDLVILLSIILLIFFYDNLPHYFFKDLQVIRLSPIFIISCVFGKYSRDFIFIIIRYKVRIFILSSCLWIGMVLYYGYNLLDYPCYARIFIGLFSALSIFCTFFIYRRKVKNRLLIHVGKNSLGIYILHVPMIYFLPVVKHFSVVIILSFVILIFSSFFTDLIRKSFLCKFILGEQL